MISAQGQKSMQERLIHDLMALPNSAVSMTAYETCIRANVSSVGPYYQ